MAIWCTEDGFGDTKPDECVPNEENVGDQEETKRKY
jgi:hypothetical protein